ncbi:imidazole glycerol phosphate synthase subunit HisH [Sulfobacillus thermotolerans]|uniref:Imidazole glycerol phosphate synthase subunit HisH n=1 Tax=Sulfobacillus thermotolerans TaxID=338644 RepID=A0ABM6RPQ3_9FIRM|nr:imidazole glycerol phosphate synthase subunit HisH [Sulfobacillus thermotolerans]
MELAVIDYGNGNLGSLLAALHRLGQNPHVIHQTTDIVPVEGVIFPGVGSLEEVVNRLRHNGLLPWLTDLRAQSTPILGICLGMQLFFEQGDEGGEGLGWLKGNVPSLQAPVLPHIGWNDVTVTDHPFLWHNIVRPIFYFVHTYRIQPHEAAIVRGITDYYESFPVAIESGSLYGVQFHPELSGPNGTRLLQNFLEVVETYGNMASR